MYIYKNVSLNSSQNKISFFQAKVIHEIKTHILRPITLFENRAVYELMCAGHRRQYGVCALHAGYLRQKTNSEYVIFIAFPLQQW
jgi:hypothetical protein